MKKEIVSILIVFLLLLVNTTAVSEDAQTSRRDSDKEKVPLSPEFGKPLPVFKVRHRKNIHMAMRRALFPERRYHLDEEVFEKFQRYSLQTPKTFSSGKSNNSIKENKPSKGKTIYVPDDYETIQEAVNHAQPGDTIIVRDGTYVGNVVIDKSYLTIKSENGPENCIVKAKSDDDPVFLICGNYTTLTGFTIMDGLFGIQLLHSSNNIIMNNTISNNERCGIDLSWYTSRNTITNNSISNNGWGVYLDGSSNNRISNNTFIKDGISVSYSYQNTIERNTVNGKPLVYLEGETGVRIEDAGQVILVDCSDIEVKNLNLSNTDVGIELWNSKNCRIESNVISKNDDGIELCGSLNNVITNNSISDNEQDGIWLDWSSNNIITNNSISNNGRNGIELYGPPWGSNNIIANNSISDNNRHGIWLDCSSNNVITNNSISNNKWDGIELWDSSNNIIANNSISDNNRHGIRLDCSSNNVITNNNILNSGVDGIYICSSICSSSNNVITNNSISNNGRNGIELGSSSNNVITNNSISNNKWDGIELWFSSNNVITNNSISNNGDSGIELRSSSNNIFYLNSFVKNKGHNAWDEGKNYWDNGTIGNYWDDYFGWDTDRDGIGEIWYPIPPYLTFNFDYHPIVKETTHYDTNPPEVIIDKPRKGYLYVLNSEIWPTSSGKTIIIGDISIEVTVRDNESGIYNVTFYIDNEPADTEYARGQKYFGQFSYKWDETAFGKHKIKVVAYDRTFNANSTELTVFIINFHPHLRQFIEFIRDIFTARET